MSARKTDGARRSPFTRLTHSDSTRAFSQREEQATRSLADLERAFMLAFTLDPGHRHPEWSSSAEEPRVGGYLPRSSQPAGGGRRPIRGDAADLSRSAGGAPAFRGWKH
jgi:hypothetical protein